jgi:hypothetical protein
MEIPEVQIGGKLERESPKKIDKGNHTVEDLDLSDYQNVT